MPASSKVHTVFFFTSTGSLINKAPLTIKKIGTAILAIEFINKEKTYDELLISPYALLYILLVCINITKIHDITLSISIL